MDHPFSIKRTGWTIRSQLRGLDGTLLTDLVHEPNTFGEEESTYKLIKENTTAWEPGMYHCVLLVDTDKGFYILDNRYVWPMTPKSLPYKWDKALREDGKWYELSF